MRRWNGGEGSALTTQSKTAAGSVWSSALTRVNVPVERLSAGDVPLVHASTIAAGTRSVVRRRINRIGMNGLSVCAYRDKVQRSVIHVFCFQNDQVQIPRFARDDT